MLRASSAKRIVEIGALRGDTTVLLVDEIGDDARLHVIDPVPQFDPTEHERRLPGRYIFHRDTSHAVLPELPAMDAALIDGDHNWHTVHGELELLAGASRAADQMLPLLIMHDVLWPYGRRDLYYTPELIPEEARQPYRRAGMEPGRSDLLPDGRGGINPRLANAEHEGGPRNGVMTALDDFAAAYEHPLRTLVIPIYFGLAIVAEERRLKRSPALAAELERLQSAEVRLELLELSESLRIREMRSEHTAVFHSHGRQERGATRYLDSIRAGLLDQHNIENETRLEYLSWCGANGLEPELAALRDPASLLGRKLAALERARELGATPGEAALTPFYPHASRGAKGLDDLRECLDVIRDERVAGDLADCGTGRGGSAVFLRAYLEAHELGRPSVWVADEFKSPIAAEAGDPQGNRMADLNMVRTTFARFGLLDDRVRFVQGLPESALAGAAIEKLALLRVDAACARAAETVDALYDTVAIGGFVIIDGCETREARAAIEQLRDSRGITEPLSVHTGRVLWRKFSEARRDSEPPPAAAAAEGEASAAPARRPADGRRPALSVVVVFYEMKREAERTLQSLSRDYQEGVEDLDYEVIVVDNGSTEGQRLGREMVEGFGPQFSYLDLGERATPSPAIALNRGVEIARGDVVGLMIDGAHMLTPGVLRYAMQGIGDHRPAMVATQQWYLGPGQQGQTLAEGYDRHYEDRLLERIGWPADGYRLFEIGHFIHTRDWFDGMAESNCLFVPREVLVQSGAFDERFDLPGGGYANLEIYERIASTPGLNIVTMLGEGSFHQLHGGTTTNEADVTRQEEQLERYRVQYEEIKGKPFTSSQKPYHYVGSMTDAARRTKTRRMSAAAFRSTAAELGEDGRPHEALPIPEDLQSDFTEAYWRSMRWRETSWLGQTVSKPPADLLAYQEMIVEARPAWIVETVRDGGGRALFMASVCELIGAGRVISIGSAGDDPEPHPRITYLDGDPLDPEISERVKSTVGAPASAILVLGLADRESLVGVFKLYEQLIPVGSWAVLEDTLMNGHPIWPAMGPGPAEAVSQIRDEFPSFEHDPRRDRLTPSFNSNGYLKRVR